MLIGIRLSDLSLRSRVLLAVATLAFVAGLGVLVFAPDASLRLLQVWLFAVIALGAYWVSFLADFRGRLARGQVIVASLFALLPWILVIVVVLRFPQVLFASPAALP